MVIATHSTAIIAALGDFPQARVGFMQKNATSVQLREITSVVKDILPIFGAHPLSSVFNDNPILLVEGDDEERIWQQVVRSSKGEVRLWPCPVGGVGNLPAYERTVNDIATAIYDTPTAYSLRDKDESTTELDDTGVVVRTRLNCRSSENLLLTNDILRIRNTNWDAFKSKIDHWINSNSGHPHHVWMVDFQKKDYDRRNADIKKIRNILIALLGITRSWEAVIGQAIASEPLTHDPHSLGDYLGPKMLRHMLKKSVQQK